MMFIMQIFSRPGIDLSFIDEGQGPPILLIHGFASNHTVNWVNTGWVKLLVDNGRRVIAFDNRGHGQSTKFHDEAAFRMPVMASDAVALLDHLKIARADIMGYSMGARITAFIAMLHADLIRTALLGGLGIHLVDSPGLPQGVADAMLARTIDDITDPMARSFRVFAEATKSDRVALAACIKGGRQAPSVEQLSAISCKVLISVGTKDGVAGDAQALAALIPGATAFAIEGRDHNLAVGDKTHKQAVLNFLNMHSPV
jgi:pimeloyl-ACP methyl ester carboxylesterase